jgi:hypothetical protein
MMEQLSTLPFLVVPDLQGLPLAEFSFYPAEELLYVRWHGHLTSEEVIRVGKAALTSLSGEAFRRMLNDKRGTTGDWREAMPWLHYEWLPRATEQGLQTIAYVLSADLAQQLTSRDFVRETQPFLHIEQFYDLDEAHQWLLVN